MAFLSPDQRELFLPLIEGIHESPPWGAFMRNLVAHTYARRAFLIVTLANAMPAQEPTVLHVAAPARRGAAARLPSARRAAAASIRRAAPRPGLCARRNAGLRPSARLAEQRAALHDMGIRYGRWLRVSAGGAADAWLLLVREREDFSATAVSALAAIAPHLTAALRTLCALTEQRLQAAMAQAALARLGVGQLAFDAGGRVMAADPGRKLLAFTPEPGPAPGRRLQCFPM
jgi:hypothetical protein